MKDQIKKIRKTFDLTQQEFADKLKVPRNTIAGYEVGKSNPSDAAINNICREFNVSEQWLRTGEGEMFVQMSMEEELAKELGKLLTDDAAKHKRAIIAAMLKMDDSAWDGLDKLLDEVIEQRKKLT